ncbi:MAG: hypothetical protein ACI8QC_001322 [Planctomycetota bacterium]|jgi:uncharacterized protein (DUF1697 family)
MTRFLGLLRGINVGGNNRMPMKALIALLEELGASEVRTYIQSGNVSFRWPSKAKAACAKTIRAAIHESFGFEVSLVLLEPKELDAAMLANPFPRATVEPKTLHLSLLEKKPTKPDLAGLDALKGPTESWALNDKVFYLHAPDGIGRSKLAARAEKLLGVTSTGRNWRTLNALREL